MRLEKKAEDGLQVVAVGGELSVPRAVALHLEGLLRTHRGLWTSSLRIKYSLLGTAPRAGLGGGGRTHIVSWGSRSEGSGATWSPGLALTTPSRSP